MNLKYTVFIIIALFFLISCDVPQDLEWYERTDETFDGKSGSTFNQVTDWFTKTETSDGRKKYILRTNDTKYIIPGGYTAYEITGTSNVSSVTADVSRQSGNGMAGYGIVFAARKRNNAVYMLAVMINIHGMYTIAKYKAEQYETLKDWAYSANLKSGYGVSNRISVTAATDGSITVKFNGVTEYVFKDSASGGIPALSTGSHGFVTVIPPTEDFPSEFVEVTFVE